VAPIASALEPPSRRLRRLKRLGGGLCSDIRTPRKGSSGLREGQVGSRIFYLSIGTIVDRASERVNKFRRSIGIFRS
jgi:hypothetical protein